MHLSLPKSHIEVAFEKCDKGNKGYLTVEECYDFQTLLVKEYKYEQNKLNAALSEFKQAGLEKATLDNIAARVNLHAQRSPSYSPKNFVRSARHHMSTSEQMIPAARIIYVFQLIKKKHDIEKTLLNEIDWCIEQLATGRIYETLTISGEGPESLIQSPRKAEAMPWLAQFSTPNVSMEEIQSYLNETATSTLRQNEEQLAIKNQERKKRRSGMANDIVTELEKIQDFLKTVSTENFNIYEAEKVMGRDKVLPLVAYHIFQQHNIFNTTPIDENSFVAFVSQIKKGYIKENPYHNDLHAADVLQMCNYILTVGGVQKIAKLNQMDVAAFLLAAIVHDFRHPGVTNGFLQNSSNDLAVAYNDKAVLENYHISEAFKVIQREKNCNIFQGLSNNEKTYMRKRMIGCVLATDMAVHNDMIAKFLSLIKVHNILNGKNNDKIINPKKEFESKQFILEFCLHIADISNTFREFNIYKNLLDHLIVEFGKQGDIEKSMNLPISFMCDRTTINLPVSQIGYINGVTKPMIMKFVEVFPGVKPLFDNACRNVQEWKKWSN